MASFSSGLKSYLLSFQSLTNSQGQTVGTVIIPKDMSLQQEALLLQKQFNHWVIGAAALVAFIAALWLVIVEILPQTKKVTLEEALRVNESATVEFKSTFHWDVRQGKQVDERRLDVLKAIAGFLNTKGGTLFVGINEDSGRPEVCGLTEDMKLYKNSTDWLQRALRDLVMTKIGAQFSQFISDGLLERGAKLVWAIVVEESLEPAFVRWKPTGEPESKKFFVREGPRTKEYDNEETWRYIKNKWG
jgi:hypothetical protein